MVWSDLGGNGKLILQLNLYITTTFGTTKTCLYRQVVVIQKHCKNTVSNDHLIKWSLCTDILKKSACQIWCENYLGWNQPFTKFVEAANNLTKLVEVGKHLTKFVEFVNIFTKFAEFANNFAKFVGFANNFYEVRKSCEQL